MGSTPSPQPLPPMPAPPPEAIDPALKEARRQQRLRAAQRRGRRSTIFTGPDGTLMKGQLGTPTLLSI